MAGPAFWAILGLYGLGAIWPRAASQSVNSLTAVLLLVAWWGALFALPRVLMRWGRRWLACREWFWLATGLAWCGWCGMLPVHRGEMTQLWDAVLGLFPLAVGWWVMECSVLALSTSAEPDGARRRVAWAEFRSWGSSMWLAPAALLIVLLAISDLAIWIGETPLRHFGAQLSLAVVVAGGANALPAISLRRGRRGGSPELPQELLAEVSELAEVVGVRTPAVGLGWQRSSARLIAMWGLTTRSAVIWVSPAVVELPAGVRRCLIAHELAHIRAAHPARRAAVLVLLAGLTWLGIAELGWWGRHAEWSAGVTGGLTVVLTLAAATVGGLIFCGVARDFELQADHEACRTLGRWQGTRRGVAGVAGVAGPDRELAEAYLAALAELTGSSAGGWFHPGWAERRRRLLACLATDRVAALGGASSGATRPASSAHPA